jgi:formylglycine-generating enzyme required for sulfatase activity
MGGDDMRRLALTGVIAGLGVVLVVLPELADAQNPGGGAASNVCAGAPSDMVCVTAGTFSMGSNIGDADELPVHTVTLSEFLIDKYEVSFGQYMQCVQAGKCGMPRYYPPLSQRRVVEGSGKVISKLPRKGAETGSAPADAVKIKVATILVDKRLPAAGITWTNAKNYCEHKGRHLPTEAQWEFAARGAKSNYYAWGGTPAICERVNSNKCGRHPKPVRSLAEGASPSGAHHMTGNVWEWVHDWYDPGYYKISKGATDPTGPANFADPVTGQMKYRYRGLRGGSWSGIPNELRTAYRYRLLPSMYANDIGFRCAKSAVAPTTRRPAAPVRLPRIARALLPR